MASTGEIRAGIIDVHAHWLPRDLLALPPGSPLGGMNDRDGELFLGDRPLSLPTAAMTDIGTIVADTVRAGLGCRVISAPPFAFPVHAPAQADDYITAYNEQLAQAVSTTDGTLVGLGLVRLDDVGAARRQLTHLAALDGVAGVAVPPLADGRSYGSGVMREVLAVAAELDLAVLVHPMQLPRPEWAEHYLVNLIGNPVESTTAVASVLLDGVLEDLPDLRICFVHGGGCAPSLIGRWEHGWRSRADVRRGAAARRPSRSRGCTSTRSRMIPRCCGCCAPTPRRIESCAAATTPSTWRSRTPRASCWRAASMPRRSKPTAARSWGSGPDPTTGSCPWCRVSTAGSAVMNCGFRDSGATSCDNGRRRSVAPIRGHIMAVEHSSHQQRAIALAVSDPAELRSLREHLRRVSGAEVVQLPGRPGPGEQGAWDILEVLAGSSGVLAVVIKALPDFIRSRRSDITVTVTSGSAVSRSTGPTPSGTRGQPR